MSMKNWRQKAKEKLNLDEQTEEIHQKFRMDKINKEFGQLSGEEFFRPITKRLDDEKSSATVEEEEEEEQEVPDYTMDEFDEINPFGDEFRPIHQHQHHHQNHHQNHHHHQQHQQHPQHL